MPPLQALVLEDNQDTRRAVVRLMELEGFETVACGSLADVRRHLESSQVDCAVVDLDLPDGSGMDVIGELQQHGSEVLVLTGHGGVDLAVEAMRLGVVDFLTKPLDGPRFEKEVRDIKGTLLLRRDVIELRSQLQKKGQFSGMVGSSSAIQKVYDLIQKVAPTEATVMITGETGSGKERVADAIHRLSKRRDKPFVSVNCGALQPTLIESELFGHEAGSFTGASKRKRGVFEQAEGGTLFLDELFEMPLELQVNLLRVLETREVTRVGGERSIPVDFRLVGATNVDLGRAAEEGHVREDLLYRLMVFPIEVPPLRARIDDVPHLAQHFLDMLNGFHGEHKSFSNAALESLQERDWPGNVRELRNTVERAFILSETTIEPDHVGPSSMQPRAAAAGGLDVRVGMTLAESEQALIEETLRSYEGDKKAAAETLGISLKTLYNRLKVYSAAKNGSVD